MDVSEDNTFSWASKVGMACFVSKMLASLQYWKISYPWLFLLTNTHTPHIKQSALKLQKKISDLFEMCASPIENFSKIYGGGNACGCNQMIGGSPAELVPPVWLTQTASRRWHQALLLSLVAYQKNLHAEMGLLWVMMIYGVGTGKSVLFKLSKYMKVDWTMWYMSILSRKSRVLLLETAERDVLRKTSSGENKSCQLNPKP